MSGVAYKKCVSCGKTYDASDECIDHPEGKDKCSLCCQGCKNDIDVTSTSYRGYWIRAFLRHAANRFVIRIELRKFLNPNNPNDRRTNTLSVREMFFDTEEEAQLYFMVFTD